MELLERFAAGDMDAFEALFREFQRDVYAWIVRIVRDRDTAEDLTVEAFWRIYRAHARFDTHRRSRSNVVRDRQPTPAAAESGAGPQTNADTTENAETVRREQWDAHRMSDPEGSFGAWARRIATNLALDHLKKIRRELPLTIDPSDQAAANPAVQRETREQIDKAFRELSPKLRIVAVLALVEDVPYEEIANALDISVVSVRVRVFRAVRILREHLAKELAFSRRGAGEKAAPRAVAAQRK